MGIKRNACFLCFGVIFAFVIVSEWIFSFQASITTNSSNSNQLIIQTVDIDHSDAQSCLNDVYDAIFVISIEKRLHILSKTLFQLNDANIDYFLWKGHSEDNPHSIKIWQQFRTKIETEIINKTEKRIRYLYQANSAYQSQKIFFIRQTFLDIIQYSQKQNLSKILTFEDDILLANEKWIQMFCEIESNLPEWFIMEIGMNQADTEKIEFIDIPHFEHKPMKYFHHNRGSHGGFAISYSHKIYVILKRDEW